jgi:eukaryotic-like serine/threonine-protein kinase
VTLKKLGRYEVIRVLGKGAMGVVYEGRDPNLDRRVAIKTVKVENLSEEAAAEYEHRFRTEARSAARLQHPNIVSVYDSDRDADVAFLVMEYIQGDDLKHHLDRGVRYSLEQSLKIIRDLLSALDYAHKQGIVHRDIKPANLLIEPGGRVKLTDFGVARIQDSGEATRTQGSMVGTLKYMAPEQVQGQKIDSRADLFSAGVMLYQLLTDKRPFDGDNDFSIIHQIIGHAPPPPSSVNPRLPPALDAVVARALAKTREERFATARDFAVALQAAIRRAEDQTVVPPANPNKRVEPVASRPLSAAGTVPPTSGTSPSVGSSTSVTQELELVYWKDVKDASDPEELQGFLEKFPAGIYADLARRRLRKLSGGEQTLLSQPGLSTGSTFAATQFPDSEATQLRADVQPPARPEGADLSPVHWVDEEYTKTLAQSRPGGARVGTGTVPLVPPASAVPPETLVPPATLAATVPGIVPGASNAARASAASNPVPVAAASVEASVAAVSNSTAASSPPSAPVAVPARRATPADSDDDTASPPARKKIPVAVLAGVAALAVAGVLAFVIGAREKAPAPVETALVAPATPKARVAAPTPAPALLPAAAPAPAAASVLAAAPPAAATSVPSTPGSAKRNTVASAESAKKSGNTSAKTAKLAGAPAESTRVAVTTTPHSEPETPRPSAPAVPAVVANASLQAVDQCKEKFYLMRQLCLAEHCDKAGARGHPLCVRYREEVRVREDAAKQQQLQR